MSRMKISQRTNHLSIKPSPSADSDMKNVDVYFKRRRIRSELDNGTKDFLKEKRDLTVKVWRDTPAMLT